MLLTTQILDHWDRCRTSAFPIMDHPDNFLAATRLTGFSDGNLWALTIEQLVFATAASGYQQFRNWVYSYGNCLGGPPGISSHDAIHPISEGEDGDLFEDVFFARSGVTTIRIRGHLTRFDATQEGFRKRRLELAMPPRIAGWDLLRLLALDHRSALLATDAERRRRLLAPVPKLLELDQWHHPDVLAGEKPSDTKCFRALAAALAAADAGFYQPIELPNTDWQNWPGGGMV
jgi:hypothetical protein